MNNRLRNNPRRLPVYDPKDRDDNGKPLPNQDLLNWELFSDGVMLGQRFMWVNREHAFMMLSAVNYEPFRIWGELRLKQNAIWNDKSKKFSLGILCPGKREDTDIVFKEESKPISEQELVDKLYAKLLKEN